MPNLRRLAVVPLILGAAFLHAACASAIGPVDRGLTLYEGGRYDAALAAFDEAVRLRPERAAAWNNRGLARLRLGQPVGALGDITKAIELAPTDPELAFNRGNVYMALGNYDYAIQDYNRAVLLQPAYARAYWNRGTAQLRRGDLQGAQADWRYAMTVEVDPAVRTAMAESLGLVGPPRPSVTAFAGFAPDMPALLTTTTGTPTPSRPDVAVGMAPPPPPATVQDAPAAMPAIGAPAPDDPTMLTLRAVSRELAGDRAGAVGDLREAIVKERDPTRRATMERLLRSLEGVQ